MAAERLDIGLCITDLDVGGAERCLVELATRLDRRRFQPVVYCLAGRPDPGHDSLARTLESAEIEVHYLGARRLWEFPWVVRRLQRLLQTQSPQVLQTFLFHANIVGRMAARRARVAHVISGIRVAERRRWHLLADRLTQRLVAQNVCVSGSVVQFSETVARLPAEKLLVIPNGVDLERFPASRPANLTSIGVPPGAPVVTYVGRLDRQKGLPWLIETAPTLFARLPECHLLVVGKGPLRPRLEQMCLRAGIGERVHFAGHCDNVGEILAASNLLVLPSIWEGMPNVVLEAMASGLPVMATQVEGVAELLGPDAEQQTVRHGDSQTFCDKVVRLIEDRQFAVQLGAKNRRRAEENFSIDRMVEAYQNLWASLVTE